jgi:SAM-dependent methyltransferase
MSDEGVSNVELARRWAEDEGPHWVAEAERYDAMARAFGEVMLDAAELRQGERVLDIGCGNGATTLEAGRRVRPNGVAVGVDLSPPMLALARQRAAAAGLDDVEFLQADAQTQQFGEGAFDVVVSRNGLMFFDDPDAAFANLARALRAKGRLAFVAWQGLERSEWILVAGMAAAPHVGIPDGVGPNEPGPFGLADPDRTRGILQLAGFVDIEIAEVVRPMRIGNDIDDALKFLRSIPVVVDLFGAASPNQQAAAEEAVRAALTPYCGPDGVVMEQNAAWLVTARL